MFLFRFLVVNLEYKNKYMLDLAMDVYLETNKAPYTSVKILDDVVVPRIPCWSDSGYIDKGSKL